MNAPCSTPSTAVVVTGGASGIGLAAASALAEVGRPVALWDLQGDAVAGAAAGLADAHDVDTIGLTVDVTDDAALADAAAASVDAVGAVGGLVHAAGIVRPGGLDALDQWDAVLAVNLRALATVTSALLPQLRAARPGSAIVGVASIEALLGHGAIPSYCASKSGMLGLVRSMADELGPDGIRVNAVLPGYVRTPMLAPVLEGGAEAAMIARVPLGRIAEPAEIGRTIRFLLSDDASYITGSELLVDGGTVHKG